MFSAEMLSWILGARRFISIARICDARTPVTVTSCNSSAVGPACCAGPCAPAFSAMVGLAAAASNAMDMAIDRGWLRYTFDPAFPSRLLSSGSQMPTVAHAPSAATENGVVRDPRLSIPMTDHPARLHPYSVYLFGRLTNQSRMMCARRQVVVALAANTAMIVRRGDESNEYSYAFPTDNQRDPPAVATQRFRSPAAPQPHLTGGPCQGDLSVETDDVGSHRCLRAAGAGSFGGTNQRQCRTDCRVVRTEPGRRSRARHRPGSPTIDSRPHRYCRQSSRRGRRTHRQPRRRLDARPDCPTLRPSGARHSHP